MNRPLGRPNQGKTQTIRERTIDVYLPTTEMVEEWKKAAETADMSLSRYVIEVVERHREGSPEGLVPNWQLEEKAAQLEKEFRILAEKYVILDSAFKKQGEDLQRVSKDLQKASRSLVDPQMARRMIRVFLAAPDEDHSLMDLPGEVGVEDTDMEAIDKFRETSMFLQEIGLIEQSGFLAKRWKLGRPSRKHHISAARRRAIKRGHGKQA